MRNRERKTPPGANPAAWCDRDRRALSFHGVAALPVPALGGHHRETHLLANGPGQESAQAVGLPTRDLEQLLGRGAARPFQQAEDGFRLGTCADTFLLGSFLRAGAAGFLRALGRLLGGSGLLPRLGLR